MPKPPTRRSSRQMASPSANSDSTTGTGAARVRRGSIASRVDRYTLYERAVQCVEAEIDFVDETFSKLRGRKGILLREDFCGTLNTSCEWVRRRKTNIAVGVDLDPVPLEWGMNHHVSALKGDAATRVHAHRGDVLQPPPSPLPGIRARQTTGRGGYDIVLAMNFSFWCFKTRQLQLKYFRAVHASLVRDGVFFLDFYGGYEAFKVLREQRKIARVKAGEEGFTPDGYNGPFTYIWDQSSYNPITGDTTCHIHFKFPDGSRIRKAFSYEWRLWTIPEIRELLAEAGFARSTVYWEGDDNKGGGNGEFTASEQGEACPGWICYLSAEK